MRTATRRLLLFGSTNGVKDPDARAYGSAVGLLTTDPRLKLIETLIVALKTAGVWTLFDRLWLFAAQNATQALTDLKARAAATAVNSPTLTTDRGYAGDATTSYVNLNYTPSTDKVALSQNSAHLSFYTNTTSVQSQQAGSGLANPSLHVLGPHSDGKMYARITDTGGAAGQGTGLTKGHFIGDRTGPTTILNYVNGSILATVTDTSAGLPTWPIIIGGVNNAGTPSLQGTGRFASFSVGGSLGAAGDVAFSSALLTFLTAIGAN